MHSLRHDDYRAMGFGGLGRPRHLANITYFSDDWYARPVWDYTGERLPLVIHVVRRPSHIVTSSYDYNLKATEEWMHEIDPPECYCDYWAWRELFHRCDFQCSYNQLLLAHPVEEGLKLEALRSRYQIQEMLRVLDLSHENTLVLNMPLEYLRKSWYRSFRCLLRFVLQVPPEKPLGLDVTKVFSDAHQFSTQQVRACEMGLCTRDQLQAQRLGTAPSIHEENSMHLVTMCQGFTCMVARHMARDSDRKKIHDLLRSLSIEHIQMADGIYHKLLLGELKAEEISIDPWCVMFSWCNAVPYQDRGVHHLAPLRLRITTKRNRFFRAGWGLGCRVTLY